MTNDTLAISVYLVFVVVVLAYLAIVAFNKWITK